MAISLYRKYRPQTFDDVVGQEHIERTLRNAVAAGNTSHAYLFCGPRGTGKTTTARLLAKALLCESGPTANPCGECDQCMAIAAGTHPDVYELDAASRTGVDNVREEIIGRVAFAPTRGRFKIYIIDEVHMLSIAAFNALLKTLEEPPSHVIFILCTTDPHKIPDTILSRCQRFDFHRISIADIMGNLRMICDEEGFSAEDPALELIAKHSLGGMRDAITTLEKLAVFTDGSITETAAQDLLGEVQQVRLQEIFADIANRDVVKALKWVADFAEGGTDIAQLNHEMTAYVRDLYVVAVTGNTDSIEVASKEEASVKASLAGAFGGPDRLARMLLVLSGLGAELRTSTDARLSLEIALIRMARPESDLTLESLAERVEALEHGSFPTGATAAFVPTTVPPTVSAYTAPQAETAQASSAPTPATPAEPSAPTAAESASAAPLSAAPTVDKPDPLAGHQAQGASPRAEAAASPLALDAGTVSRVWAAASRMVIGQKASLSGPLGMVHVYPDGDGIVLELPADSSFTKRKLEEEENKAIIRESIRQTFGAVLPFHVAVSSSKPRQAPKMPVEEVPSVDLFGNKTAVEAESPAADQEQTEPEYAPQGASEPTPEPPAEQPLDVQPDGQDDLPAETEDDSEYIYDDGDIPPDDGFYDDPSTAGYGVEDVAYDNGGDTSNGGADDADGGDVGGDDADDDSDELPPEFADLIFGSFEKKE